jgi:predicted nucleic acid-binding protein
VVDASVLIPALADDDATGETARRRLRGQVLVAPHLIDMEVLSGVRKLHERGQLTGRRAERAVGDLLRIPMRRIPQRPLLERCWELRGNLTPYDAVYVAIAELFRVPFVTADAALARVPGIHCDVEVLRDT